MTRRPSDVVKFVLTISVAVVVLFAASAVAKQIPTAQPSSTPTPPKASVRAEFADLTSQGTVFIYKSPSPLDPCAPMTPGPMPLIPLGTGFVVGIDSTEATPQLWSGWKFLVTAKHVLANEREVILRVNSEDEKRFVCKSVEISASGDKQNTLFARKGVDLVAVRFPEIEGADPTVVPIEMVADESKMREWDIGVGTQVATVGYLFGYSGRRTNFPVVKFGHISAMSSEPWFYNRGVDMVEDAYVVDLPNAPGLSGAPVFAYGYEIDTKTGLRYRELPPYVVGVVKDLLLAPIPVNSEQAVMISQGVAVIEPGSNLKALMRQIWVLLKSAGRNVRDIN